MYPHQLPDLFTLMANPRRGEVFLSRLQIKKLRRLLRHAGANIPYYQKLFDRLGFDPEKIEMVDDIRRLPLITKEEIQQLPLKEKSAANIDLNACKSFLTSGTTGLPLQFYMSHRDFTWRNLNSARAYLACGMRPWDKMAVIAGDRQVNENKSWNERIGLWRRKEISSWENPAEWLRKLQQWKPQVLIGRVTTLKLLAEAAAAGGRGTLAPRLVFSSAGILDDQARSYLSTVFAAPVIDFYFTFEGGCVAWECDTCTGYHLSSDMLIIEILKEGKPASPGEAGEVVITNLHSYAIPFIRYCQGDSVLLSDEKPKCGRHFPLVKKIYGRKDDYIVLPSGRKIPPQPVYHVMIPVQGVRRWKIIQESVNRLVIHIEPTAGFNQTSRNILKKEMVKLLREDIRIDIKTVKSIPIDPARKFKPVCSKVKEP